MLFVCRGFNFFVSYLSYFVKFSCLHFLISSFPCPSALSYSSFYFSPSDSPPGRLFSLYVLQRLNGAKHVDFSQSTGTPSTLAGPPSAPPWPPPLCIFLHYTKTSSTTSRPPPLSYKFLLYTNSSPTTPPLPLHQETPSLQHHPLHYTQRFFTTT